MKNILIFCSLIFLISCNQTENNLQKPNYSAAERLEQLKVKCVQEGDSEVFGNLVDYYANTPSNYYELLPISIIMADKYNNDNARVTIYFQMIMINNGGKRDDNLFFTLKRLVESKIK